MIIFIDAKSLTVKIYSETGMKSIAFEEVDLLKGILKNQKAIYVTNAVVTGADSIIQTVQQLQKQRSERLSKSGEPMYLRCTLPGPMNIPDIRNKNTGKKETVKFTGPFDGIMVSDLISDFGEDFFKRNKTIRKLLQKGRLQVLGESEFEDQKDRYERGELKIRSLAGEYTKYLKLLSRDEAESEILFDITNSVSAGRRAGGGANPNEGSAVISAADHFYETARDNGLI